MMLIEKVTDREFLKDHEINDLKPQNPTAPTITMDVPSSSVAPHPSCSVLAAPRPPHPSSSMGGVLMVIKSMFAWCRDTRQRQDVLLSNQKCQNEKMGIDEFDEFSLSMPPLDDDPFASLSTATSRPWRPMTMMPRMVPAASTRKKKAMVMMRTMMSDVLL
jgi:hypothetical protein